MLRRTSPLLLAALTALLLPLLSLIGPSPVSAAPAAPDPDPTASTAAAPAEAREDLAVVSDLLSPDEDSPPTLVTEPGADSADGPAAAYDPSDATLALRDLALSRESLSPREQRTADSYLARPTDGAADEVGFGYRVGEADPVCSDVVCVHYVTSTTDAPPAADSDGNDVPDRVELALASATDVHQTYVGAGYRAPASDGTRGGDARTDVYLADVGAANLYGYCAPEPRNGAVAGAAPSYCVIDNDFSRNQFPAHTPAENLQVTVAHEYFHAVQFAYDAGEDAWWAEASATWAEDELFDDINDNRFYLATSPLTQPTVPLDSSAGQHFYGTWVFVRYLTEHFRASQGGMPTLVREVWERAAAPAGGSGSNRYALQALRATLADRGSSLKAEVADFYQAARMPGRNFEEGAEGRYPSSPLLSTTRLRKAAPSSGLIRTTLDHLTATTVRFVPGPGLAAKRSILSLDLDLPPTFKGSSAVVTIQPRNGAPRVRRITLPRRGDLAVRTMFVRGQTAFVELTLVNASDQFRCDQGTDFSCAGRAQHDDTTYKVRAKAIPRG